jgi:glycosyltransferase involved in cell wall biosynthesis
MTANVWAREHDVSLVVFSKIGPFIELVEPHVKIVELKSILDFLPKIRGIIKLFAYSGFVRNNETEVVMSFAPIMNWMALKAKVSNSGLKVIIQEHCFPSTALKDRQNMSAILEFVFRHHIYPMYNMADKFIVISKSILRDFIENFGIRPEILTIVTNPVINMDKIDGWMTEPVDDFGFSSDKKYIMGMGRLAEQKNFSKLLRIFRTVKESVPEAELLILGDGDYHNRLVAEAKELGIDKSFHLLGFRTNPFKYLARVDCFCLTSNWEGMPGVITESMYCKTPVVANDCLSGPGEMIVDGVSGFLVPMDSEDKFADCVIRILSDRELADRMSTEAQIYASREYSTDKFFNTYNQILKNL